MYWTSKINNLHVPAIDDCTKPWVGLSFQLVTGIPIVIPIHLNNNHWCTIFVEPEHNTICSYDPYHNTDPVYGVLSYEIQAMSHVYDILCCFYKTVIDVLFIR